MYRFLYGFFPGVGVGGPGSFILQLWTCVRLLWDYRHVLRLRLGTPVQMTGPYQGSAFHTQRPGVLFRLGGLGARGGPGLCGN